jgi:uncharacterized protein (UPF0212 family)
MVCTEGLLKRIAINDLGGIMYDDDKEGVLEADIQMPRCPECGEYLEKEKLSYGQMSDGRCVYGMEVWVCKCKHSNIKRRWYDK